MAGERAFTAGLARFFGGHRDLLVGIGDDAAIVRGDQRPAVLCCDPVVAGVHFTARIPPHLIGRKAVNRNLADLAAMGAEPRWLLVSLLLPRAFASTARRSLLLGIRRAAAAGSATVIGGDVATHRGPLVVTVTAIGYLPGRALTRAGAQAGDTLHVTGPLGGSIAGRHLRFRPPLAAGLWLARQRAVHAAIDISDGLLLDLATLLAQSARPGQPLGAELDAAAIPVATAAKRLANGDPQQALRRALGDGEDHELLWTQTPGPLANGGPLTARARRPIGRLVARRGLWLRHPDGTTERLPRLGYQHAVRSR
jgi:thiamine-monophosphate kinase